MRIGWLLLLWVALFSGAKPIHAQSPVMEIHVHAGLIAETSTPAPGSTVTLAFTMRPDPGWHGYWINPGDAGEGLQLVWTLPPGVQAGPPRFPVPEPLIISGFMNYVYEKPHAILIDVMLAASLKPGQAIPVSVLANWLACTDRVCVPQQGRLSVKLTAGDGRVEGASRARFDAMRAALPVPIDRTAHFAVIGKQLSLAIPFPATASIDNPYFFPNTAGKLDHMAAQKFRRTGDWLILETRRAKLGKALADGSLSGLLRIGEDQGLLLSAKPGLVPTGGHYISGSVQTGFGASPSLTWLLLGAVLGGLLLNIMPCVFPILGLKAFALAKAGGDERAARHDALAYSAGVILSCLALGGLLLALRAGGEEIGWAFQLQEPGFVAFLLLLMVAITANFAGLIELGGFAVGDSLSRKAGLAGSFWTGALAAIVATPCTGPFMAAALGAALLLPTTQALLLFAALGLGIALPFLLIAYIPALRNLLPKPGPWLAKFRTAMALPMGLTALALLWLLWRLTGLHGAIVGMAGCALLLGALIWNARMRVPILNGALAKSGFAAGLLLVTVFALPRAPNTDADPVSAQILKAEKFSDSRLDALRQAKTPVFVYFTADWCVTCKVNEVAVLERAATAKLFANNGVLVLRGDFTRRNPEIARFLNRHGAAGVPLYLVYPPGGEAQKLPQILTEQIIRDAVADTGTT